MHTFIYSNPTPNPVATPRPIFASERREAIRDFLVDFGFLEDVLESFETAVSGTDNPWILQSGEGAVFVIFGHDAHDDFVKEFKISAPIFFTDNTNGQCQVANSDGTFTMWDDGTDPVTFNLPPEEKWSDLISGYYESLEELRGSITTQQVRAIIAEIEFETKYSDDTYQDWEDL